MANQKINVTELDFDQIKSNIKEYLKGQDTFSDYDFEGSGLSVLMDILAYNTHYNALYNNLTINEMFLDSASKRNSVVSIAKSLGYVPRSATCATAVINYTLSSSIGGPSSLTLPKYSVFTSSVNGSVFSFYTTDAITITGSSNVYNFNNIKIKEGAPLSYSYNVDGGTRFLIPNANADITSLKVSVQDSATSSVYTTFTASTDITSVNATSAVYFLKQIDDGLYEVTFGDGIIGKALSMGNVVHLDYFVCNFDAPNGARLFNYTGRALIGTLNVGSSVSCVTPAYGGGKVEDIESIRFNAPKLYATQNRAVTAEDYKAIIYSAVPQAQSVAVWGGEDNVPPVYGKVFVCVKPSDATSLTETQKSNIISTILSNKNVVSVVPEIVDPEYINIVLTVGVYFNERLTTRTTADIGTLVTSTIRDYNNTELKTFDGVFRFSKLSKLIDNTEQSIVNNITSVMIHRVMQPRYNVSAQYLVNIINPIKYAVQGGSLNSTGFFIGSDTNTVYYIDDYGTDVRLYTIGSNAEKIIANANLGTIDHAKGIIDIKNLNVSALNDVEFKLFIKPDSNDVVSALTQIAQIDMDNLKVTVINDNTATGDLRAGYNYVFTPSST
jgi:hypothetical protein